MNRSGPRPPKRARCLVFTGVAAVAGCNYANGRYTDTATMTATDADAPLSSSSSSTATSTTASESSTTGETTAVDGTTSTSTSTSSTSTTTEDATGTTTTAAGDTEDTTTGEPLDCWGKDPTQWSRAPLDLKPFGESPSSPRLSPDGLSLIFTAGAPNLRRVYQVSRADVDQPFGGLVALGNWPFGSLDHAMITNMGQEMFLTVNDGDVWVSIHAGGWPNPTLVQGVNTPALDRSPHVTEDGARLFFERNDGPFNPYFNATSFILYEATRAPNPAPGAPFGVPQALVLPGMTDDLSYAHVYYCATPSPDGLRLFFSSTFPNELPDNLANALRIFYTERADLDAPWASPVMIASLASDGFESCAGAVSRDGCHFVYHEFVFPSNGTLNLFTARR